MNRFAMDVSGSMYRFNGQDGRLDRLLEVVCLIMESFYSFEAKYSYSIVGHSGGLFDFPSIQCAQLIICSFSVHFKDGPRIPFINFNQPISNNKERLQILQKMQLHTGLPAKYFLYFFSDFNNQMDIEEL